MTSPPAAKHIYSPAMGWIRNWRRRRILREPFPEHWLEIIAEHSNFIEQMPADRLAKFRSDLQIFVHEKVFIGAQGFEITEEVRVVIGAAAVRLILYLDLSYFDRVSEILVYPGAYHHPDDRETGILGQVDDWNTVVLSWPAVVAGLRNSRDGHDTATHEFAHVLDRNSGAFNGTPVLRANEDYAEWGRVLSHYYLELRDGKTNNRPLLRDYAATNEAEFFAVATEVFFEKPRVMQRKAPDLYEELQTFFGADPASWGK